ncbi:hypothetical protein DSCOOX_23530 [Desulfosarcina ovata subsp. ovata]|uniref:Uncharacterized protein n=1 Tax=Desulfosarcina ovata subsp. ovata TaxID=2752305 RepID=A0A5K8A930_9BACT|nr:hypothetical protein DSCOOX_23530 [Desulfosarcina ovata subsp. ovata]
MMASTEKCKGKSIEPTNRKVCFLVLLVSALLAFSESFAVAQTCLFWWESKGRNKPAAVSARNPVRLALYRGQFPLDGQGGDAVGESVHLNSVSAWIRSPDGTVLKAGLFQGEKTVALEFPSELNPAGLNGRYLAFARMDAGPVDTDAEGKDKMVHYYAKYLIGCRNKETAEGKRPDAFFKDAEKMPLEIGPLDTPGTGEKESFLKAGFQEARKKYRMKVLYNEKPLAHADVSIVTQSGWEKRVKTDAEGTFSITPIENHTKAERCLYTVCYKDPSTGEHHCSNLSVMITAPPPLWISKAGGFDFWATLGSGLFIVYVTWTIYRKARRDHKTMLEFERYRIGRG